MGNSHDRLSAVVPVYNEVSFILPVLRDIQSVTLDSMDVEIIVVDDHSTDGTREILKRFRDRDAVVKFPERNGITIDSSSIHCLFQDRNQGKGAALRRGFEEASGDVLVVQDADREYDPGDYETLLEPILNGNADVVYGSRFLGGPHRVLYYWHYAGNRLLTTFSNMLTNLNLTDMETCYKMFRKEVLDQIEIEQDRFGVEPELTAKVAKGDWSIYEVPISYHGRTYEEGKKITWMDGLNALWCIARYNIFSR